MATTLPKSDTKAKSTPESFDLITNNSGGSKSAEAAFSTKLVKTFRKNEYGVRTEVEEERPVVYTIEAGETIEVPEGDLDHLFDENGGSKTFAYKSTNPRTGESVAVKEPVYKKSKKK